MMFRAKQCAVSTGLMLVVLWTRAHAITLFVAKFHNDTGGFYYADDIFRGTSHSLHSSGIHVARDAYNLGHLEVNLGGVDSNEVVGMSGGWIRPFTLNRTGDVIVKVRYDLNMTPYYEPDEYTQVLCSVDGVLAGSFPGQDYITEMNGGSSGVIAYNWVNVSLGVLSAGRHFLMIGAFGNKKTTYRERSRVRFRKVILEHTRIRDVLPLPTHAPIRYHTVVPSWTPLTTPTNAPEQSTLLAPASLPVKPPTAVPTTVDARVPTVTPTLAIAMPITNVPVSLAPTSAPEKIPTTAPTVFNDTESPTNAPFTSFPQELESNAPTSGPIMSPSQTPIIVPTATPVKSPIFTPSPTKPPTTVPVVSITPRPTNGPSRRPTNMPSTRNDTATTTSLFVTRINAGSVEPYTDADGVRWEGDLYYGGKGVVYSSCPTDITGTVHDPLYCNGRFFDILSVPQPYQYVIPVPRIGTYTVNLHFAELIYTTNGRRIFDVLINNELVANQVDIVDAVGPNSAYNISFTTASTVTDTNTITIEFIPLRESPIIAAIEVLERRRDTIESSSSPTLAPIVPSPAAILINCGGNNFIEAAAAMNRGRRWSADQYFTGGNPFTNGTVTIHNTMHQDLYQTERNGEFVYNVPVPVVGNYTVRLHFVEFQWTKVGQRQFTIDMEQSVTLHNVDIVALGNGTAFQAVTLERNNIMVDDGFLTIQLSNAIPPIDTPKLSGIEILFP